MPEPLRERLSAAASSFLDRAPAASESTEGAALNDRIASALVEFAAGEYRLGFETLTSNLYEFEVALTQGEFDGLLALGQEVGLPPGDCSFLSELVRA